MSSLLQAPITANDKEMPEINKIEGVLKNERCKPYLVGPDGVPIVLPTSVFQVLRQIVHYMTRRQAIFIVPADHALTTQAAADILGVSRQYLIRVVDQHKLPYHKTGTHRRILMSDLLSYKKSETSNARARRDCADESRFGDLLLIACQCHLPVLLLLGDG